MPSSISGSDGCENESRTVLWPLPSTKKALPVTNDTDNPSARRSSRSASTAGGSVNHRKNPPRGLHDDALALVMRAQTFALRCQKPGAERTVHEPLVERAGADVGGLLGDVELLDDGLRRHHPCGAQSRREGLRETRQIHDPPRRIVGLERSRVGGPGRIGEEQIPVRVVLDDQHVGLLSPLEQAAALVVADEQARGVLEVRHDVQQPHAPALGPDPRHRAIELVDVDAVLVLPHAHQSRPRVDERRNGARVRRQLHEHDVVGIDQHARDQVESLLRAARDQPLIERRGDAARGQQRLEGLEQRPVAARGAVLQGAAVVA
jgi:hypothetical protein